MQQAVDSNKKILTYPEIIGQSIAGSGLKDMDLAKAMYLTMEELRMPTAESMNIKNTVFLAHHTPDKKTAYLKIFNVDTFKNFLGNLEVYLRDAAKHGTDMFVYRYDNHSADAVFNHLRKKSIATVETHKTTDGDLLAVVLLDPKMVQKAPEKKSKKKK